MAKKLKNGLDGTPKILGAETPKILAPDGAQVQSTMDLKDAALLIEKWDTSDLDKLALAARSMMVGCALLVDAHRAAKEETKKVQEELASRTTAQYKAEKHASELQRQLDTIRESMEADQAAQVPKP